MLKAKVNWHRFTTLALLLSASGAAQADTGNANTLLLASSIGLGLSLAGLIALLRWQRQLIRRLASSRKALDRSTHALRQLGDVGKALTASLDPVSICQMLEQHLQGLLPFDAFGIALLSADGTRLEYVYYIEDGTLAAFGWLPVDHPIAMTARAFREDRELLVATEMPADAPMADGIVPSAPMRSLLFRPLVSNNRRIGVVTVQSHTADAYGEHELETLRSASAFAAIALANAASYAAAQTLRERSEHAHRETAERAELLEKEVAERRRGETLQRALYEIAALSATDAPDHLHYARLHEIVGRLMYARNFIISTYDPVTQMICQEYLVDEDPAEVKDSFPFGEGISSLVLRTRKAWLLDDDTFRELVANGEINAPRGTTDFYSWMGVPLIAQDSVYGLIIVQSYSHDIIYTSAELELLNFVASHVATLIARWQSNKALFKANAELAASAETLRLLGDIGKDLTGSLDALAICRSLEKHFASLLPIDAFGVALMSPAGESFDYIYYIEDGIVAGPNSFSIDHPSSLAALTLRENRELTLFNEDQLEQAPNADGMSPSAPILSAVFRPLIANGRRIGVVTVQSHQANAYQERELEVFRSAVAYAAIALANADAFATAENARRQAAQALIELRQAEAQLVQSEKMAALGQVIAGVAHEINTPIGAIKSSGRNISESLTQALLGLPRLFEVLDAPTRQRFMDLLERAARPRAVLSTREERAITRQTSEQLEALGIEQARHRAGILVQLQAHDNLTECLPLLNHSSCDLILDTAYGVATIISNADNINTAVDRVAKIIFALKSFSRVGSEQAWIEADLREGLETVITIYQNQIKHGTELVRNYEDLPPIRCLPDELNQIWTNLIHNALQAMQHKGTLSIGLHREDNMAVVSIGDTGCGIPEEIRTRIFDAFFTTKAAGEGSGLGLDIVKKIIEKHGGQIDLRSEVGHGTTFLVRLPITGVA